MVADGVRPAHTPAMVRKAASGDLEDRRWSELLSQDFQNVLGKIIIYLSVPRDWLLLPCLWVHVQIMSRSRTDKHTPGFG